MYQWTGRGDVVRVNNPPITPDLVIYEPVSASRLSWQYCGSALLGLIPIRWVHLPLSLNFVAEPRSLIRYQEFPAMVNSATLNPNRNT